MITIEAYEVRSKPVIKLTFSPQNEEVSKMGVAFAAFIDSIQENYYRLDSLKISYTIPPKEEDVPVPTPVPIPVSEPPVPIAIEETPQVEIAPPEPEPVKPESPPVVKNRKRKIDTKLSSI
jgi:hypothetical protein